MPISLAGLPSDIIRCIADYLNIRGYTCLSSVCQKFSKDLQDEGDARKCIQVIVVS